MNTPLTHDQARELIVKLLPEVQSESGFLSPVPIKFIEAVMVFDTIREACEPVMTEAQFNQIANPQGCSNYPFASG